MSETMVLLVNPAAGKGAARALWPRVEAALQREGLPYQVEIGESLDDLAERARGWAQAPVRALVAVGGDGTVHAVANGLVRATETGAGFLPMGILPMGRCNDIAHGLNLPTEPEAAIHLLATGSSRTLAVAALRADGAAEGRFLIGAMALGLAARACALARAGQGEAALLRAALGQRPATLAARYGGQRRELAVQWAVVGHLPRMAGRYHFTPSSSPNDAQLALCMARAMPGFQAWAMLRQVRQGTHLAASAVTLEAVDALQLELASSSAPPVPTLLDGELFAQPWRSLTLTRLPDRLAVIQPPL